MSKVIGIIIVLAALYGGYCLWNYWGQYEKENDVKEKEAAEHHVTGNQLQGMPNELNASYEIAEKNGVAGMKRWLKANGQKVEDPRRAWIELDYAVLISRDDPVEAKKIYADVKSRTPESSPVYPRIKELQKTYE